MKYRDDVHGWRENAGQFGLIPPDSDVALFQSLRRQTRVRLRRDDGHGHGNVGAGVRVHRPPVAVEARIDDAGIESLIDIFSVISGTAAAAAAASVIIRVICIIVE